MIDRRFLLTAALLPFLRLPAGAAIEVVEAGQVEKSVGEATGLFNGEKRSLAAGGKVFIDDMLQTGEKARLSVRLGEKTRLSLGERTRIRIDRFIADQGGDLVLERGAMLFDRPDDEPHQPLNVKTSFGLIVARGTRFFVGPASGNEGVFVERGLVEVQAGLSVVELRAGEGVDIAAAARGGAQPTRWSAARIADALASVE